MAGDSPFLALIPLLCLAFVIWLVRVIWRARRRRQPTVTVTVTRGGRPVGSQANRGAKQPMPEPDRWLARWHISYRDMQGDITERVVRVLTVQPRLEKLQVWCELRRDERTLHFVGLRQVADAETGEIIDMREWLRAYAASRRKPSNSAAGAAD